MFFSPILVLSTVSSHFDFIFPLIYSDSFCLLYTSDVEMILVYFLLSILQYHRMTTSCT